MNLLSKYRMELFGIAAIGTVLTHSLFFINCFPKAISVMLSYGGSGVYIFALLSGIGLHFSLSNRTLDRGAVRDFYKKRVVRVFIPYLLIVGLWYAIKYIFCLCDPIGFIYELSTLSFWIEHKGAWYVAMLIPVYLIFPLFYKWIESNDKSRFKKTAIIMFLNTVCGLLLYHVNADLFDHIRGIWGSLYFIVLGNYIGKAIKENRFNDIPLLIVSFVLVVLKTAVPILRDYMPMYTLSFALSGIIVAIIISRIFSIFELKYIKGITRYLGGYSLELYLSNLVWIQAFQFWNLERVFGDNGIAAYGLIILLGLFTSILFGKASRKISKLIR